MNEFEDFWNIDDLETLSKTALGLLKDQAAILHKKTKGVVRAIVIPTDAKIEGTLSFHLNLEVPALKYETRLLSISYPVIGIPISLSLSSLLIDLLPVSERESLWNSSNSKMGRYSANSVDEFEQLLRIVLGSKVVGEIVRSLVVNVRALRQ